MFDNGHKKKNRENKDVFFRYLFCSLCLFDFLNSFLRVLLTNNMHETEFTIILIMSKFVWVFFLFFYSMSTRLVDIYTNPTMNHPFIEQIYSIFRLNLEINSPYFVFVFNRKKKWNIFRIYKYILAVVVVACQNFSTFYIIQHCDGSFKADGSNDGIAPPDGSATKSVGGCP